MKRRIIFALVAIVIFSLFAPLDSMASDESWKKEFERICSMVEVAGELKSEEVRKLMSDADALLKMFESVTPADRKMKIYSFRLKKCRNFFQYVYDLKKHKAG